MPQYKIITIKTTAKFGRLLRPPAWKWNTSILKGVGRKDRK